VAGRQNRAPHDDNNDSSESSSSGSSISSDEGSSDDASPRSLALIHSRHRPKN
jgi:hypothetical protein